MLETYVDYDFDFIWELQMRITETKLEQIAEVIIGINEARGKKSGVFTYRIVTPADLDDSNDFERLESVNLETEVGDHNLVRRGDLLIKRVSPNFVTLVTGEVSNVVASSNMLIIRCCQSVVPAFLAGYLELRGLEALKHYTERGMIMHSVSKKELNEFMIPLPDMETQKVLGELWLLNKRKRDLLSRLSERESDHIKSIFIKTLSEGRGR